MHALHEKYIIDEKGKKTAAILPYSAWKKILCILEEYDDIRAYDQAKARGSSRPIPFKDALKKLKTVRS